MKLTSKYNLNFEASTLIGEASLVWHEFLIITFTIPLNCLFGEASLVLRNNEWALGWLVPKSGFNRGQIISIEIDLIIKDGVSY
jgi:hypothetical protein